MSNRTRRPAQPYRRPKKDPVRILAYEALRAVDERDAYANLVLPPLLEKARAKGDFGSRDAALATELVYGTLRWQGTYDEIVAACVDRPLSEVDPPVLDVLALGVHQLLGTRIPSHAGVSATVELARVVLGDGRAKFVNAVLRKVAADDLEGWLDRVAPPYDEDPERHLGIRFAHPRWIVSALWDALGGGSQGMSELLAADNARPRVTLVARPGRATTAELLRGGRALAAGRSDGSPEGAPAGTAAGGRGAVQDAAPDAGQAAEPPAEPAAGAEEEAGRTASGEGSGEGVSDVREGPGEAVAAVLPGKWSPYAVQLAEGGEPGALDAVREGRAGVQDEGSQLVAIALANAPLAAGSPGGAAVGPEAGESGSGDGRGGVRDRLWLDGCAGPGGKAALLGALAAQRGATLVAAEKQQHRSRLVARALGAPSSGQAAAHGREEGEGQRGSYQVVTVDGTRPAWRPGTFDRVLVDVPCSGLGALRRRPEARWRRRPEDLAGFAPLQRDLLRSALRSVREGGVVGYATCSPHPAETRAVVDDLLKEGGAELLDARPLLPGVPALGEGPDVQLWPHLHGTDAMYLALFRRTSAPEGN